MLSGYRAFSRRLVKSFPALARGFEIETELTIHALELRMPCAEIDTLYGSRPEESESKLSTYRDGLRILRTILSTGLMLSSLLTFGCGLLLDNVTRGRQEQRRFAYLSIPGVTRPQ
jgi:hypothetical protein